MTVECSADACSTRLDRAIVYFQGRSLGESPNANAYRKPWTLGRSFDLHLLAPEGAILPGEITRNASITHFRCSPGRAGGRVLLWRNAAEGLRQLRETLALDTLVTNIEVDSCLLGLWAQHRLGLNWILCCWDHPYPVQDQRHGVPNYLMRLARRWLVRRAMRRADLAILNVHPDLITHIGARPRRLLQLPNGVVVDRIRSAAMDVPPRSGLLGVVAGVDEPKGTLEVLRAFAKIHEAMPCTRLRLVGTVGERFAARFQRELKAEGLSDVVEITGWRPYDEAMRLAAECEVLLHAYRPLPHFYWNYVLKLGEYCALGRPIVAVDLPGTREYVNHEVNGLLVRPLDPGAMADAVLALLGRPDRLAAMGKASLAIAEAHRWESVEAVMVDEIRGVLQPRTDLGTGA